MSSEIITQLSNVTIKSWNAYSGPKENFDLRNLFYGHNGAGKTSLARAISQHLSQGAHVSTSFDRSYIESELLLQNGNSELKGVKVDFGKTNVDAEKNIKDFTEKRNTKLKEANEQEAIAQAAKNDFELAVMDIFSANKGTLKIRKNQVPLREYWICGKKT